MKLNDLYEGVTEDAINMRPTNTSGLEANIIVPVNKHTRLKQIKMKLNY
jgi:hypothetical protein